MVEKQTKLSLYDVFCCVVRHCRLRAEGVRFRRFWAIFGVGLRGKTKEVRKEGYLQVPEIIPLDVRDEINAVDVSVLQLVYQLIYQLVCWLMCWLMLEDLVGDSKIGLIFGVVFGEKKKRLTINKQHTKPVNPPITLRLKSLFICVFVALRVTLRVFMILGFGRNFVTVLGLGVYLFGLSGVLQGRGFGKIQNNSILLVVRKKPKNGTRGNKSQFTLIL